MQSCLAIGRAVAQPDSEWPQLRTNADTLPPIKLWRDRFPEKFAPLSHARAGIDLVAEANHIPVENLMSPEIIRRICWQPPAGSTQAYDEAAVRAAMSALGARAWPIDLVAATVAAALLEHTPLVVEEPVAAEEPAVESITE